MFDIYSACLVYVRDVVSFHVVYQHECVSALPAGANSFVQLHSQCTSVYAVYPDVCWFQGVPHTASSTTTTHHPGLTALNTQAGNSTFTKITLVVHIIRTVKQPEQDGSPHSIHTANGGTYSSRHAAWGKVWWRCWLAKESVHACELWRGLISTCAPHHAFVLAAYLPEALFFGMCFHKIALICTGLLLHALSWLPPPSSRYVYVLRACEGSGWYCTLAYTLISARQTGQCYLWQAHGCAGRWHDTWCIAWLKCTCIQLSWVFAHTQALKASTARRGSYLVVRAADDKVVVIGLAADSGMGA